MKLFPLLFINDAGTEKPVRLLEDDYPAILTAPNNLAERIPDSDRWLRLTVDKVPHVVGERRVIDRDLGRTRSNARQWATLLPGHGHPRENIHVFILGAFA